MRTGKTTSRSGFTLIEIMVVIAILATLMAAGTLMIGVATRRQEVSTTEQRLNALGAALEQLQSADQLGRYPPTQLAKLNALGFDGAKADAEPNATNRGIETVYAVFHLKGITVRRPDGLDDAIENTDDDKADTPVGDLVKPDLFEYVDAWGNPLVYFNARDYKDPRNVEQYVLGTGETVKVAPARNEKTGEFVRPDTFQLMSLGRDGLPNTDDDILYGKM